MPVPLPLPLRRRILQGVQSGFSAAALARQLSLPARTVRSLCARFRTQGAAALAPCYRTPASPLPSPAIQQALLLHEQHPSWGAPYLLLQLAHLYPDLTDLPSARTLQRWFVRCDPPLPPPTPPGRKPTSIRTSARQPHEIWEMDAVEQLPLQTGQLVCWLRWVDELTGAVLGTVVFPPEPLRSSAAAADPAGPAAAVWPLGPAPVLARGQRRALGKFQRLANGVRAVGSGLGSALALE